MAIEVKWMLEQNQIDGFRLIAGSGGLSGKIEKVNLLDNPDMLRWIKEGEFLITAGYILSDSEELQKNFIKTLAERNCVGLGIKLKRYMNEVPQIMISQAEEYHIPIIELPYDRSFAEMTSFLYKVIFQSELSEGGQMSLIYNRISEIVLQDRDIQELFQAINDIIPNPVIFTDSHFDMLDYHWYGKWKEAYQEKLCLEEGEPVFSGQMVNEILSEYDKRHFEVIIKNIMVDDTLETGIIFPVTEKKRLLGFIIFFEINQPFDKNAYDFVSGIRPIIALEFLRNSVKEEGRKNLRENFLKDILFNDSLSRQDMIKECNRYDFDYQKKHACAVLYLSDEKIFEADSRKHLKNLRHLIFEETDKIVSRYELRYYRLYHNNSIILFFEFSHKDKDLLDYDLLSKILEKIIAKMQEHDIWLKCGISKVYAGIDALRECYYQALDAGSLGKRITPLQDIYSYKEQEIYHILQKGLSHREQVQIYEETIADLNRYDQQNNTELLVTLKGYIENGGNVAEAANTLYIHRNTLTGRMNKIREILKVDISDYKECMMLWIGIYLKKLLETEGEDFT